MKNMRRRRVLRLIAAGFSAIMVNTSPQLTRNFPPGVNGLWINKKAFRSAQ
jgi:hypothetical protein